MVEEIHTRQAPSSRVDIHVPNETNASMAIMSSFSMMSFPKVCSRWCGKVSWSVDVGFTKQRARLSSNYQLPICSISNQGTCSKYLVTVNYMGKSIAWNVLYGGVEDCHPVQSSQSSLMGRQLNSNSIPPSQPYRHTYSYLFYHASQTYPIPLALDEEKCEDNYWQ